MFTLGEYANAYANKDEMVTIVAENGKQEVAIRVGCLTHLLCSVVSISTTDGAKVTVADNDFTAIVRAFHLN